MRIYEQSNFSVDVDGYTIEILVTLERRKCTDRSIDLKPVSNFMVATFSGSIAAKSRRICIHQIVPTIKDLKLDKHPGIAQLCALWQRWHLNESRSGTRLQLKILEAYGYVRGSGATYAEKCKVLRDAGKLNDRGHEFGMGFLAEPMPLVVQDEIRAVVASLGGKFRERTE